MRIHIVILALLLPSAAIAATNRPAPELALTYTWTHANAPDQNCGCFSLNGGSAVFAYPFAPSFSAVVEAGAVTNGNVNSSGRGLTLSDFLGGLRYSLPRHASLEPYSQVLIGVAHASGTMSPGQLGLAASNSFAFSAGGGVDFRLRKHVAIRALQADYLLTLLPNGNSGRQNSLRLSTGVVARF